MRRMAAVAPMPVLAVIAFVVPIAHADDHVTTLVHDLIGPERKAYAACHGARMCRCTVTLSQNDGGCSVVESIAISATGKAGKADIFEARFGHGQERRLSKGDWFDVCGLSMQCGAGQERVRAPLPIVSGPCRPMVGRSPRPDGGFEVLVLLPDAGLAVCTE